MSLAHTVRMSLLVVVLGLSGVTAVDVEVDLATTYQTIDGFGALNDIVPWKVKNGPFYYDADVTGFLDSLVVVQGYTIYRIFIDGCDLSPSPGVYRISNAMRHFYGTTVRRMKQTADQHGEPFYVAPAILSPPGYMKYNGVCPGTYESIYSGPNEPNQLKPESYADFGDFCAWYLKTVRDTFGIECYAFSPQNEPHFNEPYQSCSYANGAHYARMLKVVGPKIRAASPATRIYGVEHMAWAYPSWENAVIADADARDYIDRFAIHGYSDGIRVDTSSFSQTRPEGGRPLWMSETGGDCNDYTAAMAHANTVMNCLVRSSMSAWIFVGVDGADNGVPGPRYWVYSHIFRFVRPAMKRVKVTCADNELLVGAFKDDSKGSRSVVIVNNGSGAKSIDLRFSGGTAPQSLSMRRSTSSAYFVDAGSVSASNAISIPARSIVSLGYSHTGTVGVTAPGTAGSTGRGVAGGALGGVAYDLRGRRTAMAPRRVTGSRTGTHILCVGIDQHEKALKVIVLSR